jgi:LacI family transcriptional regulator
MVTVFLGRIHMNEAGSKILMKDIACTLGISTSLVSKVLSNRMGTSGVSAATAERIKMHAQEMGYQLNQSARALRCGRQNTLGVFMHHQGEPGIGIMERLLLGISDEAHRVQQKLMVTFFERNDELFSTSSAGYSGLVDGVIVAGVDHQDMKNQLLNMVRSGTPVASIYTTPVALEIPNVYTDEMELGDMALQHLIERGCKRIGLLQTRPNRHSGRDRLLLAAGLENDRSLIFDSGDLLFTFEAGVMAAQKIIDEKIDLDGLVFDSDAQASGALNTLLKAGIQVPEQIKLVAISGSPQCRHAMVPLTSVSNQQEAMGRQAVQVVMQMLKGEHPGHSHILPVLHPRASTGC